MKKICFVTTVSLTIRAFVLPVIRYFKEHTDWEITVICHEDPQLQELLPEGVRYIPVRMHRGISLTGVKAMLKMAKIFRKEKFDLIQYATPNAAFYAAIASWLSGSKNRKYHLMGFRFLGFSGVRRWIFKQVEKLACALSTDIECVSKSNMELGIEMGIFPSEKAKVLHYGSSAGVDLTRFDIQKKARWRKELREVFTYKDADCVFGYAGRITRDKGINEILTAFNNVACENKKLFIVGRMENEASLDADLLADSRKNRNIQFCDEVQDIEKYYAMMDVLLLPSYREGFGNIVIEAEAMGVPVIVTDIPGPTDAMACGKTGLVIPVRDANALVVAMTQLAEDKDLREQLGWAGHRFVEERFDQRALCEIIMKDRTQLLNS